MTVLQGVVLGIIQGLTEFLPISSSGHLVLFQKLFGLQKGAVTFDIAVHLATLIAVAAVLWKDVIHIARRPFDKLPLMVIAGTIPTVIIGAAFSDVFKGLFESGKSLGLEFIFTGLVLWFAESVRTRNKGLNEMTVTDAGIIGIAQGIAILPAVSRSGLTISSALSRGLKREFAIRFSFLMSIPAIIGAAAMDFFDVVKDSKWQELSADIVPIIAGMAAATVSGYIAVQFMIKAFSKINLRAFSYYVFSIGALVILDQVFFGRFFERMF